MIAQRSTPEYGARTHDLPYFVPARDERREVAARLNPSRAAGRPSVSEGFWR